MRPKKKADLLFLAIGVSSVKMKFALAFYGESLLVEGRRGKPQITPLEMHAISINTLAKRLDRNDVIMGKVIAEITIPLLGVRKKI